MILVDRTKPHTLQSLHLPPLRKRSHENLWKVLWHVAILNN